MPTNGSLRFNLIPSPFGSADQPTWPEILFDSYAQNASGASDFLTTLDLSLPYPSRTETHRNYTTLCYDPRELFSDQHSRLLYNCAALATSAILLQTENLSIDEPSFREAEKSFNFGSLESFDGPRVLRSLVGCAAASCSSPEHVRYYGKCGPGIEDLTEGDVRADYPMSVLRPLKSLCSEIKRDAEADIAGPGITMSYLIQMALCIWFFVWCGLLNAKPSSSLICQSVRNLLRLVGRGRQGPSPEATHLLSTWSRLRSTRFSVALFSSVVEFQEAQISFTIAVQIATISMLAWTERPRDTEVDMRAAGLFTAGNTLMVLLTQSTIQRGGMHWWYTFLLTFAVVVLGSFIQSRGVTRRNWADSIPLAECGDSRVGILTNCFFHGDVRYEHMDSDFSFSTAFIFVMLVVDGAARDAEWGRPRSMGEVAGANHPQHTSNASSPSGNHLN